MWEWIQIRDPSHIFVSGFLCSPFHNFLAYPLKAIQRKAARYCLSSSCRMAGVFSFPKQCTLKCHEPLPHADAHGMEQIPCPPSVFAAEYSPRRRCWYLRTRGAHLLMYLRSRKEKPPSTNGCHSAWTRGKAHATRQACRRNDTASVLAAGKVDLLQYVDYPNPSVRTCKIDRKRTTLKGYRNMQHQRVG